ncbi:MAG: cation diffusion facilitator family transporter [Pseudonocardiales bacterium]|nr:MAG: cation diffusion facilitator family transporter [Pseudonocardiales bacterium]
MPHAKAVIVLPVHVRLSPASAAGDYGPVPADSHTHDHHHDEHPHHDHPGGPWRGLAALLTSLVKPHSHDAADSIDTELEASAAGIRAVWLSFAALALTAAVQAAVFLLSGSVALLGDTLHNTADALTAVPLAIAFTVGRRAANRRYTYGYGRAEDLAGIVVVTLIAASSVVAGYESVRRLLDSRDVHHLGLVAVAALVGFAGNELVAQYRISVGRRIGSAALIADGLHARTDGLTSLAVLLGAGGVAVGWRWADPFVGLLITVAIIAVLRQAAREVFRRLMDAVDPALVDRVESVVRQTEGVRDVGEIRLRWIGHALRAECEVVVDPTLTVVAAHRIAEEAEHRLLHQVHRLTAAMVHADPHAADGTDHHALSRHHRAPGNAADS